MPGVRPCKHALQEPGLTLHNSFSHGGNAVAKKALYQCWGALAAVFDMHVHVATGIEIIANFCSAWWAGCCFLTCHCFNQQANVWDGHGTQAC